MSFFAKYGWDILGGLGVFTVFLVLKHYMFDKPPKFRNGGVLYEAQRQEAGPENDWQGTIVEENN